MPAQRTPIEEATSLTDFSASRISLAGKCGRAFEYRYVRQIPDPYETSAAMFGDVIHNGVEAWYGSDDQPNDHRHTPLVPLVLDQWRIQLERAPVIWDKIMELRDLGEECKNVAAFVVFKRPQLKAPTQTQEYMTAAPVKLFNEKKIAIREYCDLLPDIKWKSNEDPYVAYQKSAEIAEWIERRWQGLPRPIAVERPFAIEIAGFRIRGRIDQIRIDPHRQTAEPVYRVVDMKTSVQPLTAMEALVQMFIYSEAAREMPDVPDITDIAIYLARHNSFQQGKIDRQRHLRIVSRILRTRAQQIEDKQFEPSYGFWCKQCDYRDLCQSEISLWSGDGITAELLD